MASVQTLVARDAIDVTGPQLLRDAHAFEAIVYVQLGIIAWDYVTSLNFDMAILTGRKPFTWPSLLYLGARYGSWVVSIALLFQVNAFDGINCNTVWVFVVIGVKMQKLFAEALFAVRASAVWDHNPIIIAILLLGGAFNAAIGFSAIPAAQFSFSPSSTPGALGNCVPIQWNWELGVAYAWTLTFDFIIIGLICSRLWQMGKRTHSSFSALIFRDGVKFMLLTCIPTAVAVALFYAGRSAPAQSSAMTMAAALHSLLACRAYRNLSNFCERLPVAWRVKVSNGTMLDRDTLARIAFITGGEAAIAEAEEQLANTSVDGHSKAGERGNARAWLSEAFTGLRTGPTHTPRRFVPREFETESSLSMQGVDSKRGDTPMPIISVVTQQTEVSETMAPWTATRSMTRDPDATSSMYSTNSTTPKL